MTKSPEIRAARRYWAVEQVITDYVKFLADARDAVYRLGCDQATAKQLKEQGERQEKELRLMQAMTKRSPKARND